MMYEWKQKRKMCSCQVAYEWSGFLLQRNEAMRKRKRERKTLQLKSTSIAAAGDRHGVLPAIIIVELIHRGEPISPRTRPASTSMDAFDSSRGGGRAGTASNMPGICRGNRGRRRAKSRVVCAQRRANTQTSETAGEKWVTRPSLLDRMERRLLFLFFR